MAILLSDKADFRAQKSTRDIVGQYIWVRIKSAKRYSILKCVATKQ